MTSFSEAIPLIELSALSSSCVIPVDYDGLRLLVIVGDDDLYVIEDRCGHFGVSLQKGRVENGEIRCPTHGARFDLSTGELVNDLFEDCDPINVYLWRKNNGWLEVYL